MIAGQSTNCWQASGLSLAVGCWIAALSSPTISRQAWLCMVQGAVAVGASTERSLAMVAGSQEQAAGLALWLTAGTQGALDVGHARFYGPAANRTQRQPVCWASARGGHDRRGRALEPVSIVSQVAAACPRRACLVLLKASSPWLWPRPLSEHTPCSCSQVSHRSHCVCALVKPLIWNGWPLESIKLSSQQSPAWERDKQTPRPRLSRLKPRIPLGKHVPENAICRPRSTSKEA
ncbi:hypothetical protein BD289DRAFT_14924 [Coniella lustricola]|uniref:Uncharacterized protein n=1 Tax=Coniella lustricola TaxID=2025994 RepID=A0A2T3A450_9PEZI|nr:hypothetical protein BD289DRAFT_14924 [Coniella lustricola]